MNDISTIQTLLAEAGLDGWLLFDFRGMNPIAASIAPLPAQAMFSRRWAYWIPVQGEPQWLVHAIELAPFRDWPVQPRSYVRWQELEAQLQAMLGGARRIAMEYSPRCAIPYVSRVDGGTLEMIRGLGVEVVSSADLVQAVEARLSPAQIDGHRRAAAALLRIKDEAFAHVAEALRLGQPVTEYSVQQWIAARLAEANLVADHDPIVAVNAHAADPHYIPTAQRHASIQVGDLLLLDLWARETTPDAIMGDITWVALCSNSVPPRYQHICNVVAEARDAAVAFIQDEMAAGRPVRGCDADDVCRGVIERAGYGRYFIHRTGHSLGSAGHGNGAHLDNLETNDTRRLLPATAFTIEPGIYLPGDFGVRLEIDVLVHESSIEITTLPLQQEIVALLR
ncbi:MAG TPA: Xaa-Pro peptidase family protein [Anaerolineae bacterium]|nr:Xaa-Pro peptidase family protein [Anaerolineae bacterium]